MQRRNEQSIGEVLNTFLKASQLENRIFEDRIAAIWSEALGPVVTAETARIHLSRGTLFVALRSPSLRTELLMRRSALARAINEKLGGDVVKQVVIQ